MLSKGLILMVLHEGKNQATPLDGLILRAVGQGFKVCLFRFAEGSGEIGPELRNRMADSLEVHEVWKAVPPAVEGREQDVPDQRSAWEDARAAIASARFQLVALEELPVLIARGTVSDSEVLECLLHRPVGIHVAITGTDVPESLVSSADIVTQVLTLRP